MEKQISVQEPIKSDLSFETVENPLDFFGPNDVARGMTLYELRNGHKLPEDARTKDFIPYLVEARVKALETLNKPDYQFTAKTEEYLKHLPDYLKLQKLEAGMSRFDRILDRLLTPVFDLMTKSPRLAKWMDKIGTQGH